MAACSTSLGFTDDCMLVNVKPRVLRRSFSNASTSFSIIYSTLTTGQIDDDAVCPESIRSTANMTKNNTIIPMTATPAAPTLTVDLFVTFMVFSVSLMSE